MAHFKAAGYNTLNMLNVSGASEVMRISHFSAHVFSNPLGSMPIRANYDHRSVVYTYIKILRGRHKCLKCVKRVYNSELSPIIYFCRNTCMF